MDKFTKPKILFLDIETLPMEVYSFGMFDQSFSLNMVKQPTTMACWAAKWKGESKIHYSEVNWRINMRDDAKICNVFQDLINEADIIVGHAIERFDKKKSNYRFIVNGLKPTLKCRVIDTLKIAKKHFSFDSNKLEHLAEILKVPTKKYKHAEFSGFDLWRACLDSNPKAWAEMAKYNKLDVVVLEDVYNALIPWDNTLNFNVYHKMHDNICGACSSIDIQKWGFRFTNAGKFQRYRCNSCGKETIDRANELSTKKKQGMTKC